MNLKTIADNLATRFTGVTATVSGASESIAVGPTASLPNGIAKGPALLVYHPTGELGLGVSKRRDDTYDFPVRLLRDPLDVPARSDALYAWYDALRDKVEEDMDLGLSYVAWAQPVAGRVELDGITYGDALFDVVELIVRVRINEIVSGASA